MLGETLKKMSMLFLGIIFFGVVLWFVFQRGESISNEISPTPNTEFSKIMKIESEIVAKIRENIKAQENKIKSRNCKGFLYDGDMDGNFDNKLIDNTLESFEEEVIIKYNFCAYTTTEENNFIVIISTVNLVNEFMQKREGEEYAPVYMINADKNLHEGKNGLVESHLILEGI